MWVAVLFYATLAPKLIIKVLVERLGGKPGVLGPH